MERLRSLFVHRLQRWLCITTREKFNARINLQPATKMIFSHDPSTIFSESRRKKPRTNFSNLLDFRLSRVPQSKYIINYQGTTDKLSRGCLLFNFNYRWLQNIALFIKYIHKIHTEALFRLRSKLTIWTSHKSNECMDVHFSCVEVMCFVGIIQSIASDKFMCII